MWHVKELIGALHKRMVEREAYRNRWTVNATREMRYDFLELFGDEEDGMLVERADYFIFWY